MEKINLGTKYFPLCKHQTCYLTFIFISVLKRGHDYINRIIYSVTIIIIEWTKVNDYYTLKKFPSYRIVKILLKW